MKKMILLISFILFSLSNSLDLYSQNKASYIIPDIGAPGMNVYVELIGHIDSVGAFGNKTYVDDNSLYLKPTNPADEWKIQFSPLFVSWNGRLVTAQAFIHPTLKPNSWKWNEGINVPIGLYKNGNLVNTFNFYIVLPCPLGNIGGINETVLGEGALGMRSPRGAMLVDSLILSNRTYTVSTKDCDPNTEGNQGYLPFILTAVGNIKGADASISLDATNQNAAAGGGGGGGAFYDAPLIPGMADSHTYLKGGDGFTGGGIGGINNIVLGGGKFSSKGGGVGSGSNDKNNNDPSKTSWSGYSLNGVRGAQKAGYESAGGGTGHPFGKSGEGSYADNRNGGYGGGSGGTQNSPGGHGAYLKAIVPENSKNGLPHGNPCFIPLAGGSGGASGNPQISLGGHSGYGGGGGGAVAINAREIELYAVTAKGANGLSGSSGNCNGGNGSMGSIVLTSKMSVRFNAESEMNYTDVLLSWLAHAYDTVKSNDVTYYKFGLATDTTSKGLSNKSLTIKGYYLPFDIKLFIKAETAKTWTHLKDIKCDKEKMAYRWEYTIDTTFWAKNSEDSLYYFFAVMDTDAESNDNQYTAVPKYILTQSAANVIHLKIIKNPHIDSLEKYQVDTITICNNDTTIQLNVEKITNKGKADLIVYKSKITNTLSEWQPTVTLDAPFNNDEYTIIPNSSSIISVQYKIPTNVSITTFYDTISIWHNDTLRPNPWKVYVKIPLKKLQIAVNPYSVNLGNMLVFGFPKDTTITLVNNNDRQIAFSNLRCNSTKIDYIFTPSNGVIPPNDSVKIIVNYVPKQGATIGEFQDQIECDLDCALLRKALFIGTLDEGKPIIVTNMRNLGKITKCGEIIYLDSLINQTDKDFAVYKINLYGPDSSLFSYSTPSAIPLVLHNNEYIRFEIIAKANNTGLGTKKAYLDLHTVYKDGVYKIQRYELIFEIVEALTANPNPLYLATVVNATVTKNIKLEYQASYLAKIDTAYLKKGTICKLNNNLKNHTFYMEKDSVDANISCVHNAVGNFGDTLVVVLKNKYCNDSLFVPINVKIAPKLDTIVRYVTLHPITLCDSTYISFLLEGRLHLNTTIDDVTPIYGADKDLFSYTLSHKLPGHLDVNDTFKLTIKIQSDLLTQIGKKTATIELFTTENGENKTYIINLSGEVVPGVTAYPSSIDFGTVEEDEQLTKKIDVVNQDTTAKLMRAKIKEVKLKFGENFVITKTIPAGSYIYKDSVLVSLKPTKHGQLEDTVIIVVAYPLCDDTLKIPIKVNVKPRTITTKLKIIASKHNSVSPSSLNYKIPIYINSSSDYTNLKIDTLILKMNTTMFSLKAIDNVTYSEALDLYTVSNLFIPTLKANTDQVLLTLRGNVLLGTSDSTDISITKCVISDANVLGVDTTTGYLKLIICESGGKRLIKNIGHEPTITVIENPVKSSVLELECDVIESGNYSLEIIDILGNVQKVKEWIVTSKDTDKFKFSIPTDNYGNGNYIVVMNTPSAKFHKRFLILK